MWDKPTIGGVMVTHDLKIDQCYLGNLVKGTKKAEVRFNDRDYQVGDVLLFTDYSILDTPRCYYFGISHIHSGLGLEKGYVVLSLTGKGEL